MIHDFPVQQCSGPQEEGDPEMAPSSEFQPPAPVGQRGASSALPLPILPSIDGEERPADTVECLTPTLSPTEDRAPHQQQATQGCGAPPPPPPPPYSTEGIEHLTGPVGTNPFPFDPATEGHQKRVQHFVPSAVIMALLNKNGPDTFCPPGWVFSVYDAELQNHFAIPSQQVLATTGSLKYATYHERHGQGTRFRFQLCSKYSSKYSQGRCPDGAKCGYIHAIIDPTAIGKSIHINENLADCNTVQDVVNSQYRPLHNHNRYRLVQDGVLVAVHAPNANDETPQLIYSGNLLRTHGGLQAYNAALSQLNPATAQLAQSVRPRHCAHFQFRKTCNLGEECNFVHSMCPYVQPKFRRPSDAPLHTPESSGGGQAMALPSFVLSPPPLPVPGPGYFGPQTALPTLPHGSMPGAPIWSTVLVAVAPPGVPQSASLMPAPIMYTVPAAFAPPGLPGAPIPGMTYVTVPFPPYSMSPAGGPPQPYPVPGHPMPPLFFPAHMGK